MSRKCRWVVVELSAQGEKEVERVPDILKRILDSKNSEVFIPIFWSDDSLCKEKFHLFDGYVFCRADCSDFNFFAIEEDPHFKSILTREQEDGTRIIDFVPDSKIKSLKNQLSKLVTKDIAEGDYVEILDGTCKSLRGEILNRDDRIALVSISDLQSTELIIEVPISSLKKCSKKKSFLEHFKDFDLP